MFPIIPAPNNPNQTPISYPMGQPAPVYPYQPSQPSQPLNQSLLPFLIPQPQASSPPLGSPSGYPTGYPSPSGSQAAHGPSPPLPSEQVEPMVQDSDQYQDKNSCIDYLFQKQYKFINSPNKFMICAIGMGVIFALLAVFTVICNLNVKSMEIDYSEEGKCVESGINSDKCLVKFKINEEMRPPIYFVYYVKNIYINHRKFLNSFSAEQIKGNAISPETAEKQCNNFPYNKNIYKKTCWGNQSLAPNDIASPCGMKSQGFFNDSFALFKEGTKITLDETNIYNGSAINTNRAPSSSSTQWLDPQDPHYKLYLLDGSLLTKKRLWSIISEPLKPGSYQLLATNNYAIPDMKMTKGVLLTTASIMGGREWFYSIAFAVCSLMCLGFAGFVFWSFRNYSRYDDYSRGLME